MDWLDIREFLIDSAKYVLVVVIVLVILIYIATFQQVVGPSMSPTLNNQDVVLLLKFYYKIFDVKRNDVIAFEYAQTKYLIKRVIGLPGEHIEYIDNLLYIDGKAYEETAIKEATKDFKLEDLGYSEIPENMYLVLGDNRGDSMDSRDKRVGLIDKKDILGKVGLKIWPLNGIKLVR